MNAIIQAELKLDSLNPYTGQRLTTFILTYPRCIHSEFMTHRVFSRNSASSRAIPTSKLMQMIRDDPYVPIIWGSNQAGMMPGDELPPEVQVELRREWLEGMEVETARAERMGKLGLHKQWANRVAEPWMHIKVIVTGTYWDNFFELRCDPQAMAEFTSLATQIRDKMTASIPTPRIVHIPYIDDVESEWPLGMKLKVATGRIARISYLTQDGSKSASDQIDLHNRMKGNGHWSPFEHSAFAEEPGVVTKGNFGDWWQYRELVDPRMFTTEKQHIRELIDGESLLVA